MLDSSERVLGGRADDVFPNGYRKMLAKEGLHKGVLNSHSHQVFSFFVKVVKQVVIRVHFEGCLALIILSIEIRRRASL